MRASAFIAMITAAALAAQGTPARADTQLPLPPGTRIVPGAPQWIRIDTRIITSQLLRQTFDLAPLRGRFRAFRVEADQGTVEIARTEIDFANSAPTIDNSFSILTPSGDKHLIRFGGAERDVAELSLISATSARHRHTGRITLYGLHIPEVIVPPLPARSAAGPVQSAAHLAR